MLEILVDGTPVEPGQLELHQQSDPFPGGSRYKIRATDAELTEVVCQRYPPSLTIQLTQSDVSHIFNMIRLFISMKLERTTPLFWANTIDQMTVDKDTLEIGGACSRHVP